MAKWAEARLQGDFGYQPRRQKVGSLWLTKGVNVFFPDQFGSRRWDETEGERIRSRESAMICVVGRGWISGKEKEEYRKENLQGRAGHDH